MAGQFSSYTLKISPFGKELQSNLCGNVPSGLINHVNQVLLHIVSCRISPFVCLQWAVSLLNSVQRNWFFLLSQLK
jgi:hypothetical protein